MSPPIDSVRIIAGRGLAPPGAHTQLALRIIDRARALGFRASLLASHRSSSRYLHLVDASGRPWKVRISNHLRPRDRGTEIPHLDLISCDGVSGADEAEAFLRDAATGAIAWRAPARDRLRRRPR